MMNPDPPYIHHFPRHVLLAALALTVNLWSGSPVTGDDSNITIEEILSTWRQRQDDITALRVNWTKTTTLIKDGTMVPPRGPTNGTRRFGPPEDVTTEVRYELNVHERTARLISSGYLARPTDGTLVDTQEDVVFDGALIGTRLGMSSNDRGHGTINESPHHPAFMHVAVKPLAYHFWPLNRDMGGFTAARLALTGKKATVDSHECLVAVHRPDYGNIAEHQLFLDPSLDFAIRRSIHILHDGTVATQADTEFSTLERNVYPQRWTCQQFSRPDRRDMLTSIITCAVTEISINGPPGEPIRLSEIKYEPGDIVDDLRGGERQQLIATRSGKLVPAFASPGGSGRVWMWWALLAAAAMVCCWWTMRKG